MGKSLPRHDIPAKVTGETVFGIDAQVPGMQYAAIRNAPVFGAQVRSFDGAAAKARPGVTQIVNLGNAIAVVAESYWSAEQALNAVQIQWTKTDNDNVSSATLTEQFRGDLAKAHVSGGTGADVEIGDVPAAFAAQVIEACGCRSSPMPAWNMNATARFAEGNVKFGQEPRIRWAHATKSLKP